MDACSVVVAGEIWRSRTLWQDLADLCATGGRFAGTPSETHAIALLRGRLAAVTGVPVTSHHVAYDGWARESCTLRGAQRPAGLTWRTGGTAMRRAMSLSVLVLVFGINAQAQPPSPTSPVDPTHTVRPQTERITRPDDPIDPRVLERFRLPGPSTGVRPGVDATVRRPASAESAARPPAATVDLPAVRDRVGAVMDVRVMRQDRSVEDPPATSRTITLRRGDVLAVRRDEPAQPERAADGTLTAPSSTILYALDAAGRTRELGIIHKTAGLFWQPDRSRFAGELLVGVLDRKNPSASGPLGATVPVQLLAAPGAVDQTQLELTWIGLPLQRVTVAVADPEDPFPIHVVSQIDLDLPNAALPVRRPRLSIAAPARIPGLGVGDAVVTVSASAATVPPRATITLSLDNGWLADPTLVLGDDGTATTRIRSAWIGSGTLRVVTNPYEAAPREIDYTVPVRFLAATALGAMLGALVLVHMLGRNESAARWSRMRDWVVGVVIGVGATTMAYAGMALPEYIPMPSTLTGEIAPFALAFICAAAGTGLIHSIIGMAGRAAR